ncbi:hypothetical protein AQUCO_01300004v1 [Aquilegia coerulea]|uniref:CASP-like protein n=1 Tax=Aquilegia coerulea TaxID=218851 RepID=A0A2G5DZ48_AQUCA|nr:hypothetical protein AQUCO_01300004v1 [Aquilegia coerulea]
MNGGGGGRILPKTLIASIVLATSTATTTVKALSFSSSSSPCFPQSGKMVGKEKLNFEPRFDGMRFIETLVTAHR